MTLSRTQDQCCSVPHPGLIAGASDHRLSLWRLMKGVHQRCGLIRCGTGTHQAFCNIADVSRHIEDFDSRYYADVKFTSIHPRIFGLFTLIAALGIFSVACVGERPTLGDEVDISALSDPDFGNAQPDVDAVAQDSEVEGTQVERQSVKLAFGGDSSFQDLGTQWRDDPESLLNAIAPLFVDADFAMVNFEAALGSHGEPVATDTRFQAPADALIALRAAGIQAASMANDHGMDFGRDGLTESLATSETWWFPIIGVGHTDVEAFSPIRSEFDGISVAVFAANDVVESQVDEDSTATPDQGGLANIHGDRVEHLATLISAEKQNTDVVVVYLHYGTIHEACPSQRQTDVAERLSRAGADVIVGSHAHQLQGMGYLNGSFVAYGLGNFIYSNGPGDDARSGVLMVDIAADGHISHEWRPAEIRQALPYPLEGNERASQLQYMDELFDCTGLDREFSHE